MMIVLTAAIIALSLAVVLVPISVKIARWKNLLDVPNLRSSHTVPTPRIGGVGIVLSTLGAFAATLLFFNFSVERELIGLIGIFMVGAAVGFGDDVFQLKIGVRMLLYLALAAGAALLGASVSIFHIPGVGAVHIGPLVGLMISTLYVVWYTNLFNFMYGINGIAAATSLVTMGAFTVLFTRAGLLSESAFSAAAAASSLGFLFFNFPRAKVFMGDGGAVFIGMAAGALSLHAVNRGLISTHGVLLLMYPFIFDATFTLFRRMIERQKFWKAHRTHLYQQMCDLGLSHTSITGIYFIAASVCAVLGLHYHKLSGPIRLAAVLFLSVLSFGAAAIILRRNRVREIQSE